MATFLDFEADAALLHHSIRTHAELENTVDAVEADVLRYFTRGAGSGKFVALRGYDTDTPEDSEAGLVSDLKSAIAEIASHRLRHLDDDPSATLSVRGSRTVGRSPGALDPLWPSGWERWLLRYETRIRRT